MKKFAFVYKVAYSNTLNSVKFALDKTKKYNQAKFEIIDEKDGYVGVMKNSKVKYNLVDIDRITNQFDSEYDFFRNLHVYTPIYENYVTYTINGNIKCLQPIYGRECFNELLNSNAIEKDYVENSRVIRMLNTICEDRTFRRKFMSLDYYKSGQLVGILREIELYSKAIDEEPSLEVSEAYNQARVDLYNELRKYHFYRESLRCYDDYKKEIALKEKLEREKASKAEKEEAKVLKKTRPKYPENIGGQVFFDGFDEE